MRSHSAVIITVIAALAAPLVAAPPQWVTDAARIAPVTNHPPDTHGEVLLDDTVIFVDAGGTIRSHHRRVVRILTTEGRDLGSAGVMVDGETKVSNFRGWTIPKSGAPFDAKERDVIETAVFEGELYGDKRMRVLPLPAAEPGNVVAYEYEQRERPYALQQLWRFQGNLPVRSARLMVHLPQGWLHEAKSINREVAASTLVNGAVTWTVENVPAVKSEPGMPSMSALAGRLAVNFLPPSSSRKVHTSWNDVGAWYAGLIQGRRDASLELKAKTSELAPAAASLRQKIDAIASFAQKDVRYVAIEIGIGGYQPHKAADIFRNRYGDCKDKVTVMGSMLKQIGIDSEYVLVHTERRAVARDFASHASFNHAIIAVKLPAAVDAKGFDSVVEHERLGRLLIFDPTNEHTPLGRLPEYLQDSYGLLVSSSGGGELIHLAASRPETNRVSTEGKLTIDATGTLSGTIRETRSGWPAASMRGALLAMTERERLSSLQRRLANHLSTFDVTAVKYEKLDSLGHDLVITYDVTARQYAKRAGNMLLVRPRIIGRKAEGLIDLKERQHDYQLDPPTLETDDIEITLPVAWKIDELPPPQEVQLPQLTYSSKTSSVENKLRYVREYKVKSIDVARGELETLNTAFRKILADERNTAVVIP